MPLSQAPTFNLKAVLQETGIAADTLRAWERRYSLPKPQRTAGGHRLYSQRDIHLIKWLLARQREGLSISRAVQQWNELVASGEDPLAQIALLTASGLASSLPNIDSQREEWLASCFAFDEAGAEQVLSLAFALYPAESVLSGILLHGMQEVGNRWQHRQATVQQEHFASGLAIRRLNALLSAAAPPVQPGTIVLACPPAELHSLPLLYINVMLRRRGRNTVYLGADVPLENLEETARAVDASLVIMSAQRLTSAKNLQDAAATLTSRRIPVAYGGRVFNQIPELQQQIPGAFLGEAVDSGVDQIEELLAAPIRVHKRRGATANLLAEAYISLRPQIEAALQRTVAGQADTAVDITIANSYFGGALTAALEFGSVGYLAADMEWMDFLLTGPHLPFRGPREYFMAYAAAMRQVMDSRGSEIAEQLEQYAEHA